MSKNRKWGSKRLHYIENDLRFNKLMKFIVYTRLLMKSLAFSFNILIKKHIPSTIRKFLYDFVIESVQTAEE